MAEPIKSAGVALAPAATPPPTPSPAPAPAPAAAPPPPAPGPGAAPAAEPDVNPFAELDAKFAAADKPAQVTTGKPKPADKAPGDTTATPAAAKPAPAKPAGAAPELRNELKRLQTELETRNKSYADLEAKIKDFEARGKDTQVLTERLSEMEKTIAEKDARIRALNKEEDPEFKKQYDAPFNDAAEDAREFVERLQVDDGESGTRAANWDDFVKIWQTNKSSPQGAIAMAKELFGDASPMVIDHLMQLNRLDRARTKALQSERANAAERSKEEAAKAIQGREQINKTFQMVSKDLETNIEDYHDSPEDTEAIEARKQALAIYDAKPASLRERIVKDAHIRQRAAAFGPMKLKIIRLQAEIEALKAKVEEDAVPGKTQRPSGGTPAPEKTWEQEARETMTPR